MSKHSRPDDDDVAHAQWLTLIGTADPVLDTPRGAFRTGRHVADESANLAPSFAAVTHAVDAGATESDREPAQPGLPGKVRPARGRLRKPVLIGAAAAACLITAAAGSYTAVSKNVAIVVDGRTQHVHTLAGTVAGALAAAGLVARATDSLAPAGSTPIADGSTIVLHRAGPAPAAPAFLLAPPVLAAPASGAPAAGPVADLLAPVLALPAVPAVPTVAAAVTVAGTAGPAKATTARTVGQLLAERRIAVGRLDRVSPAVNTPVYDGLVVTVDRIAVTTAVQTVAIAAPATQQVPDAGMDAGTSAVTQAAAPGSVQVSYQVTSRDGHVMSRVEFGRRTLLAARPQIVHLGTRTPDPGSQVSADAAAAKFSYDGNEVLTHDTTFGVDWDGLSMCESTHNPRAVNANPSAGLPTYGLFQFDLPTWESVGGSGNPMDASPSEQLMRAKLLYEQRGLSPWACAYAAR